MTTAQYNYSASPHQLTFTFNEPMSASSWSSAIAVIDLNTGNAVAATPSPTPTGPVSSITYNLGTSYQSILDGNYVAVLHGSQISDGSAPPNLLNGSDGIAGHDYVFTTDISASPQHPQADFWFEDADELRDRGVGQDDLNNLSAHYGSSNSTYAQGDVNYDTSVNFSDLLIVGQHYNQAVLQLGSPAQPFAASVGTTAVQVSWGSPSDNSANSYDVYRNWVRIATGVTATTFADTGLTPSSTYTYAIVSRNANNDSSYPAALAVTTARSGSAPVIQPVPAQTILEGQTVNISTTFTDQDTSDTHTAPIAWGDGSGGTGTVTEAGGSGTVTASHPYRLAGAYTAVLTVADNNGGSAAIGIPVTVKPLAPTGLTATDVSSSEIDLAWTDNSPSATGYLVERSLDGVNWYKDQILAAAANAYADTSLADDTAYFYRVSALGPGVQSTYAGPATATTATDLPTVLIAPSADPNPVTGTSSILSVLGWAPRGEAYLTYTWSTLSGPASLTFSDNGTNTAKDTVATFSAAGSYSLSVSIANGSRAATASLSVTVNQTATSIDVTPAATGVQERQQQQFSATEMDQFGNPMNTQPSFSWSVGQGGSGSINASGLYTAPHSWPASDTITASDGAVSGSAITAVTEATEANFDDLSDQTVVTNQYAGVTFSADSGESVTVQAGAAQYGGTGNAVGVTPTDQIPQGWDKPMYVDFRVPVDNLRFQALADDDSGTIGQVNVFVNGTRTATVNMTGDADIYTPVIVDLSAYRHVTRIEITNITDYYGLWYDDFQFSPDDIRLAWTTYGAGADLQAFKIPLTGGSATPEPDTNDSHDLGSNVSIDWGDGTSADNGNAPHFYAQPGTYSVAVTDNNVNPPTTTTFQATAKGGTESDPLAVASPASETELGWAAVDGATSYDIYRGLVGSGSRMSYIGSTNGTGFDDDTGANTGSDAQYELVAQTPTGPSVLALLAPPGSQGQPPAPPPLVTHTGTADSSTDSTAIYNITSQGKADGARGRGIFVGIHDVVVNGKTVVDGQGRAQQRITWTGDSDFVVGVKRDANGNLTASGGYAGALKMLNLIAKAQRVTPQDNGNGTFQATLQDITAITVQKDGDWGMFTIQRSGEPAVTIRYTNPIQELNYRGAPPLNGNIDRIDNMDTLVEEKRAKGLQEPGNQKAGGGMKVTEDQWGLPNFQAASRVDQ